MHRHPRVSPLLDALRFKRDRTLVKLHRSCRAAGDPRARHELQRSVEELRTAWNSLILRLESL